MYWVFILCGSQVSHPGLCPGNSVTDFSKTHSGTLGQVPGYGYPLEHWLPVGCHHFHGPLLYSGHALLLSQDLRVKYSITHPSHSHPLVGPSAADLEAKIGVQG